VLSDLPGSTKPSRGRADESSSAGEEKGIDHDHGAGEKMASGALALQHGINATCPHPGKSV
jgi:hypothetical protein